MDQDMADVVFPKTKAVFDSYAEAYASVTDVEAPKRKAWNEELAKKVAADPPTLPEFAGTLIEAAQESDSSVYVFALLGAIDEVRSTLKAYLDTLFVAEHKTTGDGLTLEELSALYESCKSKFIALEKMVAADYFTWEDIVAAGLPVKMSKPRKVKGGGIAPAKPKWNCPGRINGKSGSALRTNTTTRQLLVNGEPVEGRTLGDQCMKSGIPGFTPKMLDEAISEDGVMPADPSKFSSDMGEITVGDETWTLGLRIK